MSTATAPNLASKPAARPTNPAHATAILAIICVSYFMVILDNSIIFTGLPRIESAMHFSPTGLTWVQDAYTLVFGGLLLLGSRAGDIVGRRRMFFLGLGLFGGASFLVGAAPFTWWLIAARALQGIGAAILAPSSLALLTATFADGHQRGRAVAAYSAVAGIGASLGLVVGGLLADLISWRAGFFINVPIGLAMLIAGRRYVAETAARGGRFDLTGAVCATLGMSALVFGVIEAATVGWAAPQVLAALGIGVSLLAGLVINESRAEQPIMPLRLFASRQRTGAYLTRTLYLAAMIGFFFFTTQYLQGVLGFTPLQAGLAFLPMSAINFAAALLVTRIVGRLGATPVLVLGVVATLTGMAWLSRVNVDSNYLVAVALPMVAIGIGQGLAFAPMTSAGLADVDAHDAGAASGLVNTFHQLGSSLGLGVLATFGAAAVPAGASVSSALVHRVSAALTGSAAMLSLALIVVLVLVTRRRAAPATQKTHTTHAVATPSGATGPVRVVVAGARG